MWSRRSITSSFGESGFSVFHAGHCDWQRPHSVQVAKSSRPFQVKSSILPRPKTSSSPGSSKSISVVAGVHRQQRAERDRLALERDVDRREEDVRVLAVEHDQQEDRITRDVRRGCRSSRSTRACRRCSPSSSLPTHSEANPPLSDGNVPSATCAPRKSSSVHDDVEDHDEDEPRGAGVRAVEARLAALLRRVVDEPDRPRTSRRRRTTSTANRSIAKPSTGQRADDRDDEVARRTAAPYASRIGGAEDDEAPEREHVGDAGDRPLEQPALAEDLDDLGLDELLGLVLGAARRRAGRALTMRTSVAGAPQRRARG